MLVEMLGMRGRVAQVRHFCFVSSRHLEVLLAEPGVTAQLLRELGEEPERGATEMEVIKQLRRRAIHLSLSPTSPYRGLSIEEVVVVCAYRAQCMGTSRWKRSLTRGYTSEGLAEVAGRWLRGTQAVPDASLRRKGWVVGRQARLDIVRAVAPVSDGARLRRDIDRLLSEAVFADQSFILCTSATAIEFLDLERCVAATGRYDVCALEQRLRDAGAGLLLVESDQADLAIEARGRELTAWP